MTVLQGGVSKGGFGTGGGLGGLGSGLGEGLGALGAGIGKFAEKAQPFLQQGADDANKIAFAASNFQPNFSPIAGNYLAPQNMQTQQSQMSNLYNYLMR